MRRVQDFALPGHEVLELLGYGALGEVWRARRGAELVVLRRLAPVEGEVLAEVRRQATVVRSLPSPHLVRLKNVTRVAGDDVLVLDHAACGSLEALLATRGTLTPGEVVTVLAPLAEALAQAHAHGLQHRRLSPSRVLLGSGGRPLLDGLGLDPLRDPADSLDPTGVLGPTADVWSLGALGVRMLTGAEPGRPLALPPTTPQPLVDALASALDLDPLARPTAEALAAALLAACPAAPLQGLPEPVQLPAPAPRAPRRQLPVPPLPAVAAGVALLSVVGAGWAWGSRSAASEAPPSAAPTASPDWRGVVAALDATRSRAFATGSAAPLAAVYPAGSALLRDDQQLLADLRSRHATARGLAHRVLSAAPRSSAGRAVALEVEQQLTAYVLVDPAGRVLERHTAGPVVTVRMELVRASGGWRVARVGRV